MPAPIESVGIAYKKLPSDVFAGDVLLLNDGQISLQVLAIDGPRIKTRVLVGGELGNNKGINRQGGGLVRRRLTDKDREDIRTAAALKVDYLAVSFRARCRRHERGAQLLRAGRRPCLLVAKIERAEAIKNLAEVVKASDAVMVARGDLGVEMGFAELAGLQKQIIQEARHQNRVVIMATQMMESMIVNTIPTRAEVSDVANAVMDGTDAVMLSAETAAGKHPAKVVEAMAQIIVGAEKYQGAHVRIRQRNTGYFERTDEAIAAAVMYTANHLHVKGHRGADRVRVDGAVDVARALGHSDLRLHPPRGDALPRDAVPRRVSGGLRCHRGRREAILFLDIPPAAGPEAGSRRAISSSSPRASSRGVSGGTNSMQIRSAQSRTRK
jgi:pyruvate kinase